MAAVSKHNSTALPLSAYLVDVRDTVALACNADEFGVESRHDVLLGVFLVGGRLFVRDGEN